MDIYIYILHLTMSKVHFNYDEHLEHNTVRFDVSNIR